MVTAESGKQLDILLVGGDIGQFREVRESLMLAASAGRLHTVGKQSEALAYLRHEAPYLGVPVPDVVLVRCGYPEMCPCGIATEVAQNPDLRQTQVMALSPCKHTGDMACGAGAVGACTSVLIGNLASTIMQIGSGAPDTGVLESRGLTG